MLRLFGSLTMVQQNSTERVKSFASQSLITAPDIGVGFDGIDDSTRLLNASGRDVHP